MDKDKYYMKKALRLAKKGEGYTNPNPMVGALLVKNGKIISEGYHKKAGLAHAEIEALKKAQGRAKGATLYVTLEPCTHFGKTPPCVDAIIKEKVKRVVIGAHDPNPIVNGKAVKKLRKNNISVTCGVLKEESSALNRVFNTYVTKKRPYVTIKMAQSLDGKIATFSGNSKWITNNASRRFVHNLRSNVDAVLVGKNTIMKDNPFLTSRIKNPKKDPTRVVLDSLLKIPKSSRVIDGKGSAKTILAATKCAPKNRAAEFSKKGISILFCAKDKNGVSLRSLLKKLAAIGISHLLVEGGGTVVADFLKKGFVDEMLIFISPRIIGGKHAPTSVEGDGVGNIKESIKLKAIKIKRFKEDILISGYVYRDN